MKFFRAYITHGVCLKQSQNDHIVDAKTSKTVLTALIFAELLQGCCECVRFSYALRKKYIKHVTERKINHEKNELKTAGVTLQ